MFRALALRQSEGFQTFTYPQYATNFDAKTNFSHKSSLHIASSSANHWIYKPESLSSGRGRLIFLTVKCRKKVHTFPSINKSTKRHACVPHYSPSLIPTIAKPLQLAILPEHASRAMDARFSAREVTSLGKSIRQDSWFRSWSVGQSHGWSVFRRSVNLLVWSTIGL